MKTADLYAGLDLGAVELLIPRQSISDASLSEASDQTSVSIDDAVITAFHGGLSRPEGSYQSVLVIAGKRYGTAVMPQTVTLDSEQAAPPCRILQGAFARHGLLSVSFSDTKIRYVVDIAKFTAGEDR
ncbi:MAG: hypothetical protein J6Y13_07510 [Treponema sp.]|nr:hypothetical protein [Treponema sp.]